MYRHVFNFELADDPGFLDGLDTFALTLCFVVEGFLLTAFTGFADEPFVVLELFEFGFGEGLGV